MAELSVRRARVEFGAALLADLVGAAGALLVSTRHWQSERLDRDPPLADRMIRLTGRTLDNAPTALAVVALAGVVALVAVHGLARRAVGAALLGAGVLLAWRSAQLLDPIDSARAARLAGPDLSVSFGIEALTPVGVSRAWPLLSIACGVLVALAGAWTALRGHRWAGLSQRYEAPASPRTDESARGAERLRHQQTMWNSLDDGDDPTDAEGSGPIGPGSRGSAPPG